MSCNRRIPELRLAKHELHPSPKFATPGHIAIPFFKTVDLLMLADCGIPCHNHEINGIVTGHSFGSMNECKTSWTSQPNKRRFMFVV